MNKFKTLLSLVLSLVLIAMCIVGCSGGNKDFPTKAITIIVPFGSGGGTDLAARVLAEAATEILGRPVTVSNVTGGSGTVGTTDVANATPDGYTLIYNASGPMVTQPHIIEDIAYSLDDFVGIVATHYEPSSIAVGKNSPYQTIGDLVAGGSVEFGNTGPGTIHQIMQSEFIAQSGVDGKFLPFQGGSALVTALLGGHVQTLATVPSEYMAYIETGDIRPLAVSSGERLSTLPDIPTLKESGYDIDMTLDFFLLAPKGVPDDVLKTLRDGFTKAAESEKMKNFLDTSNQIYSLRDGDTIMAKLKSDYDLFEKLIKE